jgi:hypothetical protein
MNRYWVNTYLMINDEQEYKMLALASSNSAAHRRREVADQN